MVLQVANFERRKGQRYLLEAVALLKAAGTQPPPFAVLEGDGPDEPAIRAAVRDLGLSGDVSLPGREAHVFDAYAAADVIALPSVANEDFPNVVLECMSLGKPVVASRVAGIPEQIVDGVTGVVVRPGDAEALAAAIGALLEEPELCRRMGEAARERFRQCFTAEKAVAAYAELYRRLLAGNDRIQGTTPVGEGADT
jgi:L-malate glycosyltransferase